MVLKMLILIFILYSVSAEDIYTDWRSRQFDEISGQPTTVMSTYDEKEESMAEAQTSPDHIFKNWKYRLDVVPCETTAPSANDTKEYLTKVYYSMSNKKYKCHTKLLQFSSQKLIFHKNFLQIKEPEQGSGNYLKRRMKLYHIQCPDGHSCELNLTNVDLEERAMIGGKKICLDYILLESGTNNTNEYCGHETAIKYPFTGSLHIMFRSGESIQGKGFHIAAKSFKNSAIAENSCLHYSNVVSVNEYLQYQEKFLTREYYNTIEQEESIPYGSEQVLLQFYMKNRLKSSKFSDSYNGILRLAELAERSCDQVTSAIAKSVLLLFHSPK